MELHEILSTLREEKDMKQVPASLHILFLLRLLTYMTLV